MHYPREPIAVIGSGCRFPGGSNNPSKLWELLCEPRDVQSKIDRFRADNFHNKDGHHHGASNVLSAYLLAEDTKLFDAQFFNIPLSEAEAIDPQQRLLLETVYESLEAAGHSIESLSGSDTACYTGVMCDDFSQIVYGDSENVPTYAATGSARSILSNRLSYFFNWHGPSMTIDTACSSSLVAVHHGVQSLRSGESRVAVATGTNLIFGPTMFVAESNLNMLSPEGRSRMWDAGANGYARGEGVASIVMKTLSAALRDGDHIEYIIRETGFNQDGKTPGITMPSSAMQAALIKDTYRRAGLDPSRRRDRCQYFEAHGTGTPAGDPQEAGAIHRAFFSDKNRSTDDDFEDEDILYVGSIKTVIGHTEGTAGLAGMIKAGLAIQNGFVPPNMLFRKLNPALKPYYDNLKILTELQEWPRLPPGVPKRASINSFGFGGANAHAIIESYEGAADRGITRVLDMSSSRTPYPFFFSANSESSLAAQLNSYLAFLDQNPDLGLDTLSWSLFRRTAFNFRISFAAKTHASLVSQIKDALNDHTTKRSSLGTRVNPKSVNSILGVFTGQGAQWPTMGRELIVASHFARSIIVDLEQSLAELPDGPEWSLEAELLAPKEHSRISESAISQPLCTAVQIMVVALLRQSGVSFSGVVGHSSGEIACAYVSGFLSARDAIRVAYYRGKHTSFAKRGSMIAAGTGMQDANELCALPKLKGKAQLAAINSSASVTISGDSEAIDLVEKVMQDESKFVRKLKVNTAYHSFHMQQCSSPYIESLKACGISVKNPAPDACPWFSSVTEENDKVVYSTDSTLATTYWSDNMLRPVRFQQALFAAINATGTPGLVLEIGPHPALKGPASLTIEEALGVAVPYLGTIVRGQDDSLAVVATMGSIWNVLGASMFDLQAFQRSFVEDATFEVSKTLPGYTWDHERVIWNETRISKAHRLRPHRPHELLGVRTTDDVEGELRWRNYLMPKESPWLTGHQIQGQMVFPAAGFAVMALESARSLAPLDTVQLMELQDFSIHKALSFLNENVAVETIFALSKIHRHVDSGDGGPNYITADFACYGSINRDVGELSSMASGKVKVTIAEPSETALPGRQTLVNNFIDTDVEHFYDSLAELGYGYTSMFKGITDLQRTNGGSRGTINISLDDESPSQSWIIHPATLDVAFQASFAAVGAPGDGRLWTLHVPTLIDSIAVNVGACHVTSGVETPVLFDAFLANADQGIASDIDLFDGDSGHGLVQIQGLHVTPFTRPTAADDKDTFAAVTWGIASADLTSAWIPWTATDDDQRIARFAERLSLHVVRQLCTVLDSDRASKQYSDHQQALRTWAQDIVATVKAGRHPTCEKSWLADTWDILQRPAEILAKTNQQISLCLWTKEKLLAYMLDQLSIEDEAEVFRTLSNWSGQIPGFKTYNEHLAKLVDQISFKHRNLKVLEIGSGLGMSTRVALDVLGDNFTSYTFTDVDNTHFDEARGSFAPTQIERMVFKELDIETSPTEQGFLAGNYDLVIASNNLHRSADIESSLRHVRTLLRPGGFLALLEPTSNKSLAISLGACLHPDWFCGLEQSRKDSPFISQKLWNNVLLNTGFSGIDTATPEEQVVNVPFSVMCSTAVNELMDSIREPLSCASPQPSDQKLLILGGRTLLTSRLVRGLTKILTPFFHGIMHFETIVDVDEVSMACQPTTISLLELDEPLFKPFTPEKFTAIVKLCDTLKNMLWITMGSRGENPYMNMMVGVGRCLAGEMPNLRLQFLNFDGADKPTTEVLASHLLRMHLTQSFSGESKKPHDPLYTIEREMTISNGTLLVPRYLPVPELNTRLNADRRLITREIDQSRTAVEISISNSAYKLLECSGSQTVSGLRKIVVDKSSLESIRIGDAGCFHVVFGTTEAGQEVIAVSPTNRSIVCVPATWAVEVESLGSHAAGVLAGIAADIAATTILDRTAGPVLVHEPSPLLASCLSRTARQRGQTLNMISISDTSSMVQTVHPGVPSRSLVHVIPRDVSLFVDLSSSESEGTIASHIEKLLGPSCEIMKTPQLFSHEAFGSGVGVENAIKSAVSNVKAMPNILSKDFSVVPVSMLTSLKAHDARRQIVDWTCDSCLPVKIMPAGDTIRFRSDKTYFFVGLTGELGLQMTKWMIQRGARHFALASRNPQLDPIWLQLVQSQGAIVKTYAMDVTSRSSVQAVHKKLCAEMPPVAGVANGAMILIDGLFANKTHADFDKTLRPKVDGTANLDSVFYNDDLDFFIVFSSLACVSGNMGQTAYAAANAFMCSLAAGRRMRGLAGSAINMPGIVGLGYLNRDHRKLDRLKNVGYVNISEWDFYQFLSEAIVAGRPNSGMNPEITAGLQRIDVETHPSPPFWANTPRFHWLRTVSSNDVIAVNEKDTSSVRTRLAEMTSEDDIRALLLDGILGTLYARLNMNPEQRGITPDTAIVELGIDSLLAVDMRSWFTKELDLDMPVLKILGGATAYDLVDDAFKRLSPGLIPLLNSSAVDADTAIATNVAEELLTPEVDALNMDVDVSQAASDIQSSKHDPEEGFTVVCPLDLPFLDDDTEPSSTSSEFDDSFSASSQESSSIDSETRVVDDSADNTAQLLKCSSEASDMQTSASGLVEYEHPTSESDATPAAKLFSHLPEQTDAQLEYIKKGTMSYATSRFWFLMQYLEDPTSFNLLCHLKCTGPIRHDDAERCVKEIGNRHEVFRTAFFADSEHMDEPTMGVLKESPLRLESRRGHTLADVDAEIDEMLTYEFKLEQGESIRVKMISLDENTHHVLFGFHHISLDGFSFNVLLTEINMLYDSQPLPPVTMQFSDFADRQRLQVADGSFDEDLQYWKNIYSSETPSGENTPDFPEPLPLFSLAQSPRRSLCNYEHEESMVNLGPRTVRQIKALCRRHKITTFHFFLAVYRVFLFRHLETSDLTIGVADANRVDKSLDGTVGFMLNLLPLRFKQEAQDKIQSFKEVATHCRKVAYDALGHSRYPFDALLEQLDVPRSTTHSPLFQAWMDYRPFNPKYKPTMFGAEASGTPTVGRNGYDLTLDINEINGTEIRVSLRTQKYLYSAESNKMLFESYMRLVTAFGTNFELPVDSVQLWDEAAVEAGKTLGQGPRQISEWPETVSHRILEQALRRPTQNAVSDGSGRSYTHKELVDQVQTISQTLVQAGVGPGSRIAIFQEPSADWIFSLLAIWHVGGTYIPMDLRSSMARLAVVAKAARPTVVLCHSVTSNLVSELHSTATTIDVSDLQITEDIELGPSKARHTTAAAILFTSGSTGVPKGVVLTHAALCNTFEGLTRTYNIGAERVLQQSAFTFDFSLDQIICGLANGGSIYVVPKEARGDPVALSEIIRTECITYTRATPSEYASWIDYGAENLKDATEWRFAWAGGESMPRSLRQSISDLDIRDLRLYNSYGPAETITCTKAEVPYDIDIEDDSGEEIPAGFPLPNYSVFIVDRDDQLVPPGVVGEILIGGPSVALGYLNDKKQTDAKFVSNTFAASDSRTLYRTGDLGRLRKDGSLMVKGRISGDTQVKIRGMRIELQDIESCILEAGEGAIFKAVVSVRGDAMLVAHVQFAPGLYEDDKQQNAFLRSLRFILPLPAYMMPALFIPVDHLPTNPHGKTDRAAVQTLPLPKAAHENITANEPLNATERELVSLWKEFLPAEAIDAFGIGRHSNFFEVGGNSLLMVKMQALIAARCGVKLTLIDILGVSTLGDLAIKIDTHVPSAE